MLLRWLISAIGFATLKDEARQFAGRLARNLALAAAIAVLWVIAFGFGLAALTIWLADVLGAAAACTIIAAALAVIGLALQLTLALTNRKHRSQARSSVRFPGLGASAGGEPAGDGQALGSIALIALAGYLLGRQIFRK